MNVRAIMAQRLLRRFVYCPNCNTRMRWQKASHTYKSVRASAVCPKCKVPTEQDSYVPSDYLVGGGG